MVKNLKISIKIIDKIVINTDALIMLEDNGLSSNERILALAGSCIRLMCIPHPQALHQMSAQPKFLS